MKCDACGLDNDPELLHCDNCEHPLGEPAPALSPARAPAASPFPRPRAASPNARPSVALPLARPLTVGGLALLSVVTAGSVAWAMTRDDTAATASPPPAATAGTTDPAGDDASVETPADPQTLPTGSAPETAGPGPDPETVDAGAASEALAAQTEALDELLDSSEQSRTHLLNGIQQSRDCSTIAAGLDDLRTAGTEREQQRSTLSTLDLSALATGNQLRVELDAALSHSLDADHNFVRWAEERAADPCGDSEYSDTCYAAADADSTQAGYAKQRFLALWNPVALSTGLPQRDRQGL